jgi:RES domain-containing protein
VPVPVKARAVDGVWIRHAPGHSDLLGGAATPTDGRWQRANVTPALYLADSPETATAEWYRSLAERGFYPEDYLPFDITAGASVLSWPISAAATASTRSD